MTTEKITRNDLRTIKGNVESARRLSPGGNVARVTVHMGTCGLASGAGDVMDALLGEINNTSVPDIMVRSSGCIGLCSREPLVTVETVNSEPVIYAHVDQAGMQKIFRQHIINGKPVVELALARGLAVNETPPLKDNKKNGRIPHISQIPFFGMQKSIALRNRGLIDPDNIEEYIWRDGYSALARALTELESSELISEVKISGLRGRGGGGFPTGMKWEFCAAARGDQKYVLCNADEGDPGAFMDRSIMEGDPHAIIEGMTIAAKAIGAHSGFIYCRAEYPLAVKRFNLAIEQARDRGLLGKDILESGFDFDISIYRGAGAFVCGEETALMASIEGLRGTPRPRPPFPAVSGLWKKPTVLNNVETYSNIPWIIKNGGAAYAGTGTESSKGTKVFALTGKVRNVGLVEVPMGTSIGRIIFDIGEGIPDDRKFKAAQLGGPSGGCLPVEHLNTPTDYEEITKAGAIMGSGGMIVMDQDTCMVDMARYFMDFCQDESCGKCTPCRVGTKRMLEILERICSGEGREGDIELLEDLAGTIKDCALCGLGQTAPNPVLSTIRYFRHEYEEHIRDRHCRAAVCSKLFSSPCQHMCPVGTNVPGYIALLRAGKIDDAYRVLSATNPFPSVCARVCSHPCESRCRRGQLDEPVAIRNLKRFITDNAKPDRINKLPVTMPEKIAVIGAGPSGLTAAFELKKRGYAVTVYEEAPRAGGMLLLGIPEYRLPAQILENEIQRILDTGITLHTETRVGRDIQFEELEKKFDIIYIAAGAHRSLTLGIQGENSEGVLGAVEFLRSFNMGEEVRIGQKAVIIGGGNAALDASRTALRLGCKEVTIAYRREMKDMPALEEEIHAAIEEGIRVKTLVGPKRITADKGHVTGVELVRMGTGDFDMSGRRKPVPIEGSNFVIEADTVISAIGQIPVLDFLSSTPDVEISGSIINVDRELRTRHPKVWAGGDSVTGPKMAIDAIRAGRVAAESIDRFIREGKGEKPLNPDEDGLIEIPQALEEEAYEMKRTAMPHADSSVCTGDFREVETGYSQTMAMAEAHRCLRCDTEDTGSHR